MSLSSETILLSASAGKSAATKVETRMLAAVEEAAAAPVVPGGRRRQNGPPSLHPDHLWSFDGGMGEDEGVSMTETDA